jgi:hypothetical protein
MQDPRDVTRDDEDGELIPSSLAPCFQEYALHALDLEADRELIVERVLAQGNRAELRWLIGRYGLPFVADWLDSSSARRLPRGRHRLWSVILKGADVPREPQERRAAVWPH